MFLAPRSTDPVVLSYLALRKAVGVVAVALPFAVAIPWWILHQQAEPSISDYYYTGMRNLFVGCLCAIAMFMLCCRGYDWKDEVAGMFSAVCAIGVAFFPTTPQNADARQSAIGSAHYIFAALLFSTLAFFCLVLFKMTAVGQTVTRQKLQRNLVYTICGAVIIASIVAIGVWKLILKESSVPGHVGFVFVFETTALFAFGIAWLTKGETFLKDEGTTPARTRTTDGHLMVSSQR